MIKILIADDEPLARERLLRLVKQLDGYEVVPKEASNGVEAFALAQEYSPEIVLLDINMPGANGLETAEKIKALDNPPAIIFCTAHDQYALQAFSVAADGYLVKPVRLEQLTKLLASAIQINNLQARQRHPETPAYRTHISAKTHKGNELVAVHSVICFIADNKYVSVMHEQGEVLIEDSLKGLEQEFGDLFLRVHRNALINVKAVERLSRNASNGLVVYLKGLKEPLSVSRRHASLVRKVLESL